MAGGFSIAVRGSIYRRSNGCCERCGISVETIPASIHHRRPRGMGGSRDPKINGVTAGVLLCGTGTTGCHGWVESNRALAIEQGWLVPRRDPRDPTDVPVLIDGSWWKLTPFGYQAVDLTPPF